MGDVLRFMRAVSQTGFWTNQEKAELFRLTDQLSSRDYGLETATGISDSGDPWFIVYDSDSGDVLVHVARINGRFVVHQMADDVMVEGDDLRRLISRAVEQGSGAEIINFSNAVTLAALALVVEFFLTTDSAAATGDDDHIMMVPIIATLPAWHNDSSGDQDAPAPPDRVADRGPAPGTGHGWTLPVVGESMLTGPARHAVTLPVSLVIVTDGAALTRPAAMPSLDVAVPAADLRGDDGDDRLVGGPGNDVLIGNDGHDSLFGGNGDDLLIGGAGNDLLVGDAGRDTLIGGEGDDRLIIDAQDVATGGAGADTFIVTDSLLATWVTLVNTGTDMITLSGSVLDFRILENDRLLFDSQRWQVVVRLPDAGKNGGDSTSTGPADTGGSDKGLIGGGTGDKGVGIAGGTDDGDFGMAGGTGLAGGDDGNRGIAPPGIEIDIDTDNDGDSDVIISLVPGATLGGVTGIAGSAGGLSVIGGLIQDDPPIDTGYFG